MIEINWTLIAQIINFLALVVILNMVLFRPIRNSLRQRQAALAAYEAALERLAGLSQGIDEEIVGNLAAARRQGVGQRDGLKQEGSQEEASLLDQVKQELDANWTRVEAQIKKDVAKARNTLKAQAKSFAQELAAKILGRKLA
jgi:F-type H+-transporting ATPase subunit b